MNLLYAVTTHSKGRPCEDIHSFLNQGAGPNYPDTQYVWVLVGTDEEAYSILGYISSVPFPLRASHSVEVPVNCQAAFDLVAFVTHSKNIVEGFHAVALRQLHEQGGKSLPACYWVSFSLAVLVLVLSVLVSSSSGKALVPLSRP